MFMVLSGYHEGDLRPLARDSSLVTALSVFYLYIPFEDC